MKDDKAIQRREQDYWEARTEFEWLSEAGIQSILELLPPIRSDILELCSGSGMFTRRIPGDYDSYTCLDLSHSLLDRLHKELPQITPVQGNAENPSFPPASFDMVMVFAGLHHLPNEGEAIQNAFNVLREDGVFIAFEPNARCWYRKPMLSLKHILKLYTEDERFLVPDDILRKMSVAGFRDIEIKYSTPEYNPDHLKTRLNSVLSKMLLIAAAIDDGPRWQSFFVIFGKK
jgi:SAM-dependent methyltransferase